MAGWSLQNFLNRTNSPNQGNFTPSTPWLGIDGAAQVLMPQRLRDVIGKQKISQSQNIYDADFEYGAQPLRWENLTVGAGASIVPLPGLGGVQMNISGANCYAIRQSRPYHRYQPGKTFYMATNVNFGGPISGQFQRVGIFDDGNGIFFQQGTGTTLNPSGMAVVIRSDSVGTAGGMPTDTVIDYNAWNGDNVVRDSLDWTKVQMLWMEYAWYGAGALRWGVFMNGEPYVLHQIGVGNSSFTGSAQIRPWSRTGNLPVRYEQRNITATAATTFLHYGVSVLIEGRIDPQRGFTYSYGMNPAVPVRTPGAAAVRYPLMSFRMRSMGQISQTNLTTNGAVTSGSTTTLVASAAPFVASAYVGRMLNYFPQIGTVTGTALATATFTGSIAAGSSLLTISGVTGTVYLGQVITGITGGTFAAGSNVIVSQISGTVGGAGVYNISIPNTGTVAAATGASGAGLVITLGTNNLTTADVVTLTGFTTATGSVNGVYPVIAATATTITVNLGYASNPTTIGNGVVTAQYTARISANTTTTLTIQDVVSGLALPNPPTAGCVYSIGLIDRGQLLPATLLISSTATCVVELIASTPTAQVGLNGANFQAESQIGSANSFAERDVSAINMSGGEVVYAFTSPASGLQQLDLTNFFPVLTNIKGNIPDILTVAITTATGTPSVGVNVVCQEAMS